MDRFVTPVIVAVGVDLKIQGQAFNTLLRGEIRAEAVHRDENLQKGRSAPISDTQTPGRWARHGLARAECWSSLLQAGISPEKSSKIPKKQYNALNSLYEPLQGEKPLCPE